MDNYNNPNAQRNDESQGGGCSGVFLAHSILSIYDCWRNGKMRLKQTHQQVQFEEELSRQKDRYEDRVEAEEHAFKIGLRNSQREFSRKMKEKKLLDDLALEHLKMFFEYWPLETAVETLLEKKQQTKDMCFVIGKAYAGDAKDAFSRSYPFIVDKIESLLSDMGAGDGRVYRFKDEPKVVGGPALANIYAMMSTFPTVVIMPAINQKDKKISLSVGCWTPDSLFPFQKKVLQIDYDPLRIVNNKEYLSNFKKEYSCACFTIAAVLNDTYNLSEGYNTCLFPRFFSEHALLKQYPEIAKFAIREYCSYVDTQDIVMEENGDIVNIWDEISGGEERGKARDLVNESINLLKKA